jgi:hypothetical protein
MVEEFRSYLQALGDLYACVNFGSAQILYFTSGMTSGSSRELEGSRHSKPGTWVENRLQHKPSPKLTQRNRCK